MIVESKDPFSWMSSSQGRMMHGVDYHLQQVQPRAQTIQAWANAWLGWSVTVKDSETLSPCRPVLYYRFVELKISLRVCGQFCVMMLLHVCIRRNTLEPSVLQTISWDHGHIGNQDVKDRHTTEPQDMREDLMWIRSQPRLLQICFCFFQGIISCQVLFFTCNYLK